ncbi:MAG: hypothetical protein HOI95_05920 [Chromatiales bacterium]|nr:hypothetical protein [Chromatiales bacterium]
MPANTPLSLIYQMTSHYGQFPPLNGCLVRLNPLFVLRKCGSASAEATALGAQLQADMRGGAFDNSGRLWAVDSLQNRLLTIDVTTGTIVSGVALTLGGPAFDIGFSTDIAFRTDGTLILNHINSFYSLSSASGALSLAFTDTTLIDNLITNYTGIAFSGASSQLSGLEANGSDDLFSYNTSSTHERTL